MGIMTSGLAALLQRLVHQVPNRELDVTDVKQQRSG
jgi:hypothetical protein